jgi:lysozyme family protein
MLATYAEAIRRLLMHEGGYTNHPSDPGGPTNFGITIHDYRKYINPAGTAEDVRAMTVGQARAIYKSKYWDAQQCDKLPAGVDYSIFDYGVNSGIGRSGKVLRRVCGLSDATHIINGDVLKAVAARSPAELVKAINDERIAFLKRLKTWPTFGKGWGRRVAEVRAYSLDLVDKRPATPMTVPDVVPGKGQVPKPDLTKPAGGAVGGVVATGAGMWNWIASHPLETGMIAIIVGTLLFFGVRTVLNKRRDHEQEAAVPDMRPVPPA